MEAVDLVVRRSPHGGGTSNDGRLSGYRLEEVLPIEIRESLRDAPDPAQIVVFTSFTTFARASELEPGCAA